MRIHIRAWTDGSLLLHGCRESGLWYPRYTGRVKSSGKRYFQKRRCLLLIGLSPGAEREGTVWGSVGKMVGTVRISFLWVVWVWESFPCVCMTFALLTKPPCFVSDALGRTLVRFLLHHFFFTILLIAHGLSFV